MDECYFWSVRQNGPAEALFLLQLPYNLGSPEAFLKSLGVS